MTHHEMLLGELKEFKRTTLHELKELRKEVRSLRDFKWKLIGISSGSGAVASLLAMVVREIMRKP